MLCLYTRNISSNRNENSINVKNSSTVKRHVCRQWLHAEHIDACTGCKRRSLIILLKNSSTVKRMFLGNGYMQSTSMHVVFVSETKNISSNRNEYSINVKNSSTVQRMFLGNGYMQSTSMHVVFVNEKYF